MKDKAGIVITVDCRVAEVDFSFGDGTVESITVPCKGGGCNVGVLWDDPAKEGPAWSAEGGGCNAGHLTVIETVDEAVDETGEGSSKKLTKGDSVWIYIDYEDRGGWVKCTVSKVNKKSFRLVQPSPLEAAIGKEGDCRIPYEHEYTDGNLQPYEGQWSVQAMAEFLFTRETGQEMTEAADALQEAEDSPFASTTDEETRKAVAKQYHVLAVKIQSNERLTTDDLDQVKRVQPSKLKGFCVARGIKLTGSGVAAMVSAIIDWHKVEHTEGKKRSRTQEEKDSEKAAEEVLPEAQTAAAEEVDPLAKEAEELIQMDLGAIKEYCLYVLNPAVLT